MNRKSDFSFKAVFGILAACYDTFVLLDAYLKYLFFNIHYKNVNVNPPLLCYIEMWLFKQAQYGISPQIKTNRSYIQRLKSFFKSE